MTEARSLYPAFAVASPDAEADRSLHFALLGHHRTNNVGDQIQSLAARRFLPRVDAVVERDAIGDYDAAERTRLICNGWFMHHPERFGVGKNLEPLFISFHTTPTRGMDGIEYSFVHAIKNFAEYRELLNRWGPIGARDLYTWRMLREAGVDAYFSGCLTLTLENEWSGPRSDKIILVDVAPRVAEHVRANTDRDVLLIHHSSSSAPSDSEALSRAEALLAEYSKAHLVITSRLHVSMPCLGLGTPIILVGDHLEDPRFSGLKDLCVHTTTEGFSALPSKWLDQPEPNPSRHLTLRRELMERVKAFIADEDHATAGVRREPHTPAWALARHLDLVNHDLEQRVKQLESERDGASGRAGAAEEALSFARCEIALTTARFEEATGRLEEATARLEEVERERDAASERIGATEVALVHARAEIEDVRAHLQETEAERDAVAGREVAAEEALAQANTETRAAHARIDELQAERDQASARATVAEDALAQARAEIEAVQAHLGEIEIERDQVSGRAAAAAETLVRTRAEVEVIRVQLGAIETERNQASDRVAAAEETLAQSRGEMQTLRARLGKTQVERDAVTARSVASEQALAEAHAEAERAAVRIAETRAQYEAAISRANVAEEMLADARVEIETGRAQTAIAAEENGREREELHTRLEEVHARLTAREGEFFDLLQTEFQRAAMAERLEQELAAARTLAEDRLAALDAAQSALAQAQGIERDLGAEVESLRSRVAAVSDDLAAAHVVNEAVLAALRDPPAPPPRETWLAVLLRRAGFGTRR